VKVGLIPSDVGGCCFYRLAWPGSAVKDSLDWDIRLFDPHKVSIAAMPGGGVAINGIEDVGSFDLFVLQRLPSPLQVEFIRAVQSVGVAVVVDVDDALWRIDPDNTSHARWNERVGYASLRRFEILDAACALADGVTVSTPYLARRYGTMGRVTVLRNGLPDRAFRPDGVKTGFQAGRTLTLGWAGSLDSHPHDLQVMGDAVSRLFDEDPDLHLHIVGDVAPVADLLEIPEDRSSGTGWLPLDKYHEALRDIDIMLVPLEDTPFNQGKSALKAQEGAAAGALVVASATSENERLYALGGFSGGIVRGDNPHVWLRTLRQVVAGARGLGFDHPGPKQARFLEYTRRAREWAGAWQEAVDHRKGVAER
jgi:glycosyltransferase involved in cell wall biosynthesis